MIVNIEICGLMFKLVSDKVCVQACAGNNVHKIVHFMYFIVFLLVILVSALVSGDNFRNEQSGGYFPWADHSYTCLYQTCLQDLCGGMGCVQS